VLTLDSDGFADVQSVVWLDERHVVIDVGDPGRARLRLVVRDDGAVVARHPILSGTWGIEAAFGPPSGPWVLENGIELRAVAPDGSTIWQSRLPFLSAEAGPQRAVVDAGRVRWLGGNGQAFDLPAPWTVEADR
jgi:hypothetical protein